MMKQLFTPSSILHLYFLSDINCITLLNCSTVGLIILDINVFIFNFFFFSDWAIDNDAWGHALFLASKMDERTHNNIMLRFANSIPHNDPLQTLYQLMSGFVPQAATV